MKPPLFIRPLTEDEQQQLEAALQTPEAFTLRRAQYLLASARGMIPRQIAATYGGSQQSVRNVIRAYHTFGLEALKPQSRRPQSVHPQLEGEKLERLQHILHQSPRCYGKQRSLWTQTLLAQVAYEEGLTAQQVSHETIRLALRRMKAHWKRAKHWISSPDPLYALKKSGATA